MEVAPGNPSEGLYGRAPRAGGGLPRLRRFLPEERDQHGDPAAVLEVVGSVQGGEIALLELDRDEDVRRRDEGEEEVADRHVRRGVEGDDEAEHERVPDVLVESRDPERRRRVGPSQGVEYDLAKPEEVEVIDDERRQENDDESEGEERPDRQARNEILDFPDDRGDGPPLPVEKPEDDAREEDECAPLHLRGNDRGPPPLEPLPRHHAVLDPKEAEEGDVHDQRFVQGSTPARIDVLGDDESPDEADGVEERGQERDIRDETVNEGQEPAHGNSLRDRSSGSGPSAPGG